MRHSFGSDSRVEIDSNSPNTIESALAVEVNEPIADVNVRLSIEHTYTQDLSIVLVSPDGTEVLLVRGEGGSGDGFTDTVFDDAARSSVAGSSAPFAGTFRPAEPLARFNGKNPAGTWRLRVRDSANLDGGALLQWTLTLDTLRHVFSTREEMRIDSGGPGRSASPLLVDGLGGLIVSRARVNLDIDHTWTSDLRVTLVSPSATAVVLVERAGGNGDDFRDTVFSDDATSSVESASAPFSGSFQPQQPLSRLQGELANGNWQLVVEDLAAQDGGALRGWQLELDVQPAKPRVDSNFQIAVRFLGGLSASQRSVFEFAAARWQELIKGSLPAVEVDGETVTGVVILAEGRAIDGPSGVLGEAGPELIRPETKLPIRGIMAFDSADLENMENDSSLVDVIVHEMGHVLGLGTLWKPMGLIAGSGTSDPRFIGPLAQAAYQALGGDASTGVPLANTGGPGTAEGHWRDSVFRTELMTGYLDPGSNPVSRLTLAALEDMGYEVNYDAADAYQLPTRLERAALVRLGLRCCTRAPEPREHTAFDRTG